MSNSFNVTFKNVRIAFPCLAAPATEGKSKGKYSVQVSFPKDSANTALYVNAVNNAIRAGVELDPKFKGLAARAYTPGMTIGQSKFLQDGDFKTDSKGEPVKTLEGMYFFQPSSNTQPQCYERVNGKIKRLEDPSVIYSGDYCDLIVAIKPGVSKEHGIYLGVYLHAVLAYFEGENLQSTELTDADVAAGFGMEFAADTETKKIESGFAPQEGFKGWA